MLGIFWQMRDINGNLHRIGIDSLGFLNFHPGIESREKWTGIDTSRFHAQSKVIP
jgi:hypothetical protein